MHFFVTSIAWTETSEKLLPAIRRLTDTLNALLGDADFGGGVQGLTIVVVADKEDPQDIEQQRSKVFSFNKIARWPETEKKKTLLMKVIYSFQELQPLSSQELLKTVSLGICKTMQARPTRCPRGFEYERLVASVAGVMAAFHT